MDLLSPYGMLLHYSIERILPPTTTPAQSRAAWPEEGKKYWDECRAARVRGNYKPGEHYTALEGEDRILLPNLRDLYGLRNFWCWEARPRPHLPTWSFAKVPRLQFSPEENARLLSVYMRPWTLRESESTRHNPLLSLLGKCEQKDTELQPLWQGLPVAVTGSAHDSSASPARKRRHIQAEQYTCSGHTQKKLEKRQVQAMK